MRASLALALAAGLVALSAPAHAQDLLEVRLDPWASRDGVDRPFRYLLTIRAAGPGPSEVVADRRLLELSLRAPGRRGRVERCRHPHAPRAVEPGRVLTPTAAAAGESGGEDPHVEWVDLRMYCWGRALRALEAGGEITPRYGFRRAGARTYVARVPGASVRSATASVTLPPFEVPARPRALAAAVAGEGEGAPASPRARVELRDRSSASGGGLTFAVALRATAGTERVHARPPDWSFVVDGPLGTVRCGLGGGGGHPAPELYRRITPRVALRETLEVGALCPRDTFALEGVYEVVPEVTLTRSGEEYGLGAVTGTFTGPRALMRVTRGDRGYLQQVPPARDAS